MRGGPMRGGPMGGGPMRGGPMRGGPMGKGARWRAPRRPPGRAHTTAARLPPAISPPPPLHALTCLVHMVAHHGSTYLQAPQVSVHPVRRGAAACRAPHHAPSSGLLSVNGTSACAAFAICLCPRRLPLPGAGDRRTDLMVPDAAAAVSVYGFVQISYVPPDTPDMAATPRDQTS